MPKCNIGEYNKLGEDPEKALQENGHHGRAGRWLQVRPKKLPFIVIVVDELADLILEEGKDNFQLFGLLRRHVRWVST